MHHVEPEPPEEVDLTESIETAIEIIGGVVAALTVILLAMWWAI